MPGIKSKDGEIQLSARKIIAMSLIVAFFSIVANIWERKQRIKFHKHIKYKTFSKERLQKCLDDFEYMISCEDPYIENFNKKKSGVFKAASFVGIKLP
ncbi:MAG TPA: hypothetical protein GXX36_06360 [Clostridiaceae bacterium]|nr:hypothetical protein [Clostridiaceae bacterium]